MNNAILLALREIELKHECKILFACESGSRAWGFPSLDSDYDVRFIYLKPVKDYLRLVDTPDTINCFMPNELDLSGWDLKKLLIHFSRSNMSIYEWIGSPIIYLDDSLLSASLNRLMPSFFNLRKGYHHYRSMALKKYENFLLNGSGTIKDLLYSIRCLIAALFITNENRIPNISLVVNLRMIVPDNKISKSILELIRIKAGCNEKDDIVLNPAIGQWMNEKIQLLSYDLHAPTLPTNEAINGTPDPKLLEQIIMNYYKTDR